MTIALVLFMSSLIDIEPSLQENEANGTTFLITDLERQCDGRMLDLLALLSDSQACQKDDDCEHVDFKYGYQGRGSCLFPVQKGKIDLVSTAIIESSSCVRAYCRSRPFAHRVNSPMATCQNNICVSYYVPGIHPERLIEQTFDSINERILED